MTSVVFDTNFTEVCSIDNKWALVQVMAWRRTGDKPVPEPMVTHFTDAALGEDELNRCHFWLSGAVTYVNYERDIKKLTSIITVTS